MRNGNDFERAVGFVLRWEGGYVDDPADPGGETKFGISRRAYPDLDIKSLAEEDARAIYRRDYWERAGCGDLPWPMSLVVFDTSVNMGVGRALEMMKRSGDWMDLVFTRIERYSKLAAKDPRYLRGWINRVVDLYRTARTKA